MKLDDIVAEFADLEPRERLELLLEFAENLPPLPERYRAERDAGLHRIVECQTPTFIWVELVDGHVQIFADVAPEAPTVKGFVGILVDAFNGQTPETVLATPPRFAAATGPVGIAGHGPHARLGGDSALHSRTSPTGGRIAEL